MLLKFGNNERESRNWWSVNDAFQGTQVFGSTGSGKSSGSGKAIAREFLLANFGGLVLTAKTDERAEWVKLAKETGREDHLIIFGEGNDKRFNFLRYECDRPKRGGTDTESLVNLFCSILEVADRKPSGNGNDSYWMRAAKQLLRNAIDLVIIGAGIEKLELALICKVITSAPTSIIESYSQDWRDNSKCADLLTEAKNRAASLNRQEDFEVTEDYWLREFAMLAPETRGSIVNMFTTMADCFLRGLLRELFCTGKNFSPEDCFNGKIIILDLPVKEYHELGIFAQVLFKYVWQRAVERRIPPGIGHERAQEEIRPVFLWADESQFFVNQYDALFQSTARSSRACTVYLTQNLPGYQSALGGANSSAAEAFLGNLQTKIFHANGDPKTNEWASSSIGRVRQVQLQGGISQGEQNRGSSHNASGSMQFEFVVQPQEFTELRTGGFENEGLVDAIIFQSGRRWMVEEGRQEIPRNFIRHEFKQPKR